MRTTLGGAVAFYNEKEPRGEYVLVLDGFSGEVADELTEALNTLSPEEHIQRYIDQGMSKMDATKKAAKDRGMSKSELYKLLNC